MVEFVNGEGVHAGQGLTFDLVDKASAQTITGIKTFSAELVASGGVTGDVTGNADSATDFSVGTAKTKFDGIETGATADQTGTEIKTAYEGEADTNAFTDTEKTKLSIAITTDHVQALDATDAISVSSTVSADAIITLTKGNATTETVEVNNTQDYTTNDVRAKTALNASGAAPIYGTRAWINFNGITATITENMDGVNGSGNIASLVKNATGDYTITFTTAIEDDNYAVALSDGYGTTSNERQSVAQVKSQTTTTINIVNVYFPSGSGATLYDTENISVSIIR